MFPKIPVSLILLQHFRDTKEVPAAIPPRERGPSVPVRNNPHRRQGPVQPGRYNKHVCVRGQRGKFFVVFCIYCFMATT